MNLVGAELSRVVALVHETQHPLSVLASCSVFSLIHLSVRPGLLPKAVLLVLQPLPHIASPVGMRISALAAGLVVEPLPLVDISIGVVELSFTVGLVAPPLSHIP